MLDPRKIAELDQGFKFVEENLPPLLRGLHEGLLKEGFAEEQSMRIVLAYVASINRPAG